VEEEGGHERGIAEGETAVTEGRRREQATGDRQQATGKWKRLEKRLH
jgi:hypothetical protein